jgi:hypothetical protein
MVRRGKCRMALALIRPTPFQRLRYRRPDKAQPPSGNRCRGDNAGWRVNAYPAYKTFIFHPFLYFFYTLPGDFCEIFAPEKLASLHILKSPRR